MHLLQLEKQRHSSFRAFWDEYIVKESHWWIYTWQIAHRWDQNPKPKMIDPIISCKWHWHCIQYMLCLNWLCTLPGPTLLSTLFPTHNPNHFKRTCWCMSPTLSQTFVRFFDKKKFKKNAFIDAPCIIICGGNMRSVKHAGSQVHCLRFQNICWMFHTARQYVAIRVLKRYWEFKIKRNIFHYLMHDGSLFDSYRSSIVCSSRFTPVDQNKHHIMSDDIYATTD